MKDFKTIAYQATKVRKELTEFNLSPLMDVWYPENPINQA